MTNRLKEWLEPNIAFESYSEETPKLNHQKYKQLFSFDIQQVVEEVFRAPKTVIRNIVEKRIAIRNLRHPALKLKEELIVHLQDEGDFFTAISYDVNQYGQGITEEDAIGDVCEVISEYYQLLKSESDNLSDALKSHLDYLNDIIEER
jgi:hypothetical protein